MTPVIPDRQAWWVLLPLAVALGGLVLLATAVGSVSVPLGDAVTVILARLGVPATFLASLPDPKWDAIIFLVRLPRVLGATVIGAALAVAGTVMQGLLRNRKAIWILCNHYDVMTQRSERLGIFKT